MRTDGLALTGTDSMSEWAKTIAAIGGIFAGLWALGARILRRHRERRARRELEGKALRYQLDAVRQMLRVMVPGPSRLFEVDELERQKALIDMVRDELWIADGHHSEREEQRRVEGIVRVITRTQAIERREQSDAQKRAEDEARRAGQPPMLRE